MNLLGFSKRYGKTALQMGIPFGVLMGLFGIFGFSLLPAWRFEFSFVPPLFGVTLGLVSGVLFGVFMGAFAAYQGKKFAAHDPCAPGETLLRRGPANHFRRGEGVGGYLWLTNERLLFKSHRYNIHNHDLSIPLGDVRGARTRLTAGFVPNGLEIVTTSRRERFVVEDRRAWAEEINVAREPTLLR